VWDEVAGVEGDGLPGGAVAAAASVVVPNFSGMSMAEAIRVARKSGVELTFDELSGPGGGVAVKQKPAPGPAARGVVCRVAFGRRE
jgi:hypothetical protein